MKGHLTSPLPFSFCLIFFYTHYQKCLVWYHHHWHLKQQKSHSLFILYVLTSITEDWAYLPQLIQASQPKNASQHTSIIKYFQGFFHRTELCLQLRTSSSVTPCWVTRTRDLSKKVFGIILICLPMIYSKTLLFELFFSLPILLYFKSGAPRRNSKP